MKSHNKSQLGLFAGLALLAFPLAVHGMAFDADERSAANERDPSDAAPTPYELKGGLS